MARSLEEMASRGYAKMKRKLDQMSRSWDAAKDRMIKHYRDVGFGPTRTSNYEDAIREARIRFDPDKWKENWLAKMKE